MKGFETFDTTNKIYGGYYKREQDPITSIPIFKIPEDEENFYRKTLEMRQNYFDRYAHLYENPNVRSSDNKIDLKVFKEEEPYRNIKDEVLKKPHVMSHELPEKEISQSFPKYYKEY